jgi:hypothetical protein
LADISIDSKPIDAVNPEIFEKPFYSSNFFYSSCQQFTISLNPRQGLYHVPVSATVAVADPMYLETIAIPAKGTIVVTPSCGANSTLQDPGLPTALDYINALATQAKAVKQALDSKGSSGAVSKGSGETKK